MMKQLTISELQSMSLETKKDLSELLISVVEDGASIGFLPPLSMNEAEAYWQNVIKPDVMLWTVADEGKIVGTIQLHLAMKANASHRAEVAKLMVHPNFRRNGAARLLMNTAEQAARLDGRTLLVLDTRAGDPSNTLYRSLGYIEAGRIPKYARSADGDLHETVYYYKEINDAE
jgi:ribosomal protein S18 acetylase RimI-like enzyme